MASGYPDRFRLGVSDAASFDVQFGRNQRVGMTILQWDAKTPGLNGMIVTAVKAVIRRHVGDVGTALLSRDLVVKSFATGDVYLQIEPADFAALTWDLGQKFQVAWLSLYLTGSDTTGSAERKVPVFDAAGRAAFPFRIHQLVGDSP